jgi:hypothetical protein
VALRHRNGIRNEIGSLDKGKKQDSAFNRKDKLRIGREGRKLGLGP